MYNVAMKSRRWKEIAYPIYYGISREELIQQIFIEIYGSKKNTGGENQDSPNCEVGETTNMETDGMEVLPKNKLAERV